MLKNHIKNSTDRFKDLVKQSVATDNEEDQNIELQTMIKLEEVLFYLNMLKNSTTVKTANFEALTRIYTGQKIYVDTRDISVAPHLMMDGTWEPEITKIFREHINKNDVVIDIGANFGYFGIIAGADIGSNGKVIFIEANSQLIPYITKSVSVNGLNGRAKVLNIALAEKESIMELQILEDYLGSSSLHNLDELAKSNPDLKLKLHNKQNIRATTLDIICKENGVGNINVIKLDIEGYEEAVYPGMRKLIKKSPDLRLFIEFTISGYKNPKKFFGDLQDDFEQIYAIAHEDGELIKVSSYQEVKTLSHGDWIMLFCTKIALDEESYQN